MKTVFFRLTLILMTLLRSIFPYWNVDCDKLPITFEVESVSDICVAKDENDTTVFEYPTLIKLCHQPRAEDNGKLLAAFESWGSTYPIYESNDDAETWQYLGNAEDNLNHGYKCNWMPFLYELPADIGEFKKGTVILAATSLRYEGSELKDSTITLFSSNDLGRTFNAFCNVDSAGGLEWGVWEPYLIYEEQTGRLFCFYSDDSDPEHSQKLVYKYTTDLVNWSELFECVACEDYDLRPGMVSVTKMGNGKYFMVYEMVGISANPVYCKVSDSLDDWGDVADYGELVSAAGKSFGSSPYVVWTPAGGECGTLIVVGKHPVKSKSNTGTDMFISTDYGKTFIPIDNPIPYDISRCERSGYSPSLFFSEDGETLYYANNPPCYTSSYKISVAKIKISERKMSFGEIC